MELLLKKTHYKVILLIVATVLSFFIAILCLINNIYSVYQSLFLIPMLMACFWFGKKGFIFSIAIDVLYFLMSFFYNSDNMLDDIIRFAVFILIADLTYYLTEMVNNRDKNVKRLYGLLKKELVRFNKVAEIACAGIWEMNLKNGKITWSDAMYRFFGFEPQSFEPTLGKRLELTYPDDHHILLNSINKAVKQKSDFKSEYRVLKSDGSVRWVLSLGYVELDENNEPKTLIGIIVDITDEKNSQIIEKYYLKRTESLISIFMHEYDNYNDLLDFVLEEAIKLTDSKIGFINFYDRGSNQLVLHNVSKAAMEQCRITDEKAYHDLDGVSIWDEAVKKKEPVIINDYSAGFPLKKGYPKGHAEIKRFFATPVFDGNEIAAVIGLGNKDSEYTRVDAEQTAILMKNAWEFIKRKKAEAMYEEERKRLITTISSIGEGVVSTDLNGNITILNKVAESLTGWQQEDAVGKPLCNVLNIFNVKTHEKVYCSIDKLIAENADSILYKSAVLVAKDGIQRIISCCTTPVKDKADRLLGAVVVFKDITEEKRRQDEMRDLSYKDSLTGLYNRRYFEKALEKIDTDPSNLPISVIFGDVNGLKITNDTFGHEEGDRLLHKAAEAMLSACRVSDIISRWGGDEFVILLPKTNQEQADVIIKNIKENCRAVVSDSIGVSVSFGCCAKQRAEDDMFKVFKIAEDRMYENKMAESKRVRTDFVSAIMRAMSKKHPYEEKHSKRVGKISAMIGEAMKLPESDIKKLKSIGLLHDIGKISIDQNILDKPGMLSYREWHEIKRHPEIGFRILTLSHVEIAAYVFAHHEHYDGSGYPKGLEGEEIPLYSRIVAVADAYDAMTSDRTYRAALKREIVIEELVKNKSRQFDPDIIDVFISDVINKI